MPAKRKKTQAQDEAVYEVTYSTGFAGVSFSGMGGGTVSKKVKSSGWSVQDGLVTFYGSGAKLVIPERSLVSIERLD